jgi:hypothetical protein
MLTLYTEQYYVLLRVESVLEGFLCYNKQEDQLEEMLSLLETVHQMMEELVEKELEVVYDEEDLPF